jgi:hypothetical protein
LIAFIVSAHLYMPYRALRYLRALDGALITRRAP